MFCFHHYDLFCFLWLKGASVIRMAKYFLGEDVFRVGVTVG